MTKVSQGAWRGGAANAGRAPGGQVGEAIGCGGVEDVAVLGLSTIWASKRRGRQAGNGLVAARGSRFPFGPPNVGWMF